MMRFGQIPANAMIDGPPKTIPVTPGATINLDITSVGFATWTASQAETINAIGTQQAGQRLNLLIKLNTSLTISFGTGFKASGALTGVLNKTALFYFVSDGTNFLEIARNANL